MGLLQTFIIIYCINSQHSAKQEKQEKEKNQKKDDRKGHIAGKTFAFAKQKNETQKKILLFAGVETPMHVIIDRVRPLKPRH